MLRVPPSQVAVMASAKGALRCCPEGRTSKSEVIRRVLLLEERPKATLMEGRDFVDEVLDIPGRGSLRLLDSL